MVSSGLTVNTDVSHFRLAAHLSVAFLILGLIFGLILIQTTQIYLLIFLG